MRLETCEPLQSILSYTLTIHFVQQHARINGIKCLGEIQEDVHHMLTILQSPIYKLFN